MPASEDRVKLSVISPLALTRKTLCAWLAAAKNLSVVLDVDSALDSLDLIRQSRPDILILDVLNPTLDLEIVARMAKLFPQLKMLLLSDGSEEHFEHFELQAVRAGAQGCVSKRSDPKVLEEALRVVGTGEIWMSHRVAARIIGQFRRWQPPPDGQPSSELTKREKEILTLLADGYHNKEIASRLVVSENTVKTHVNTIYRKLGVNTRVGAALKYFAEADQERKRSGSVKLKLYGEAPSVTPSARQGASTARTRSRSKPAVVRTASSGLPNDN